MGWKLDFLNSKAIFPRGGMVGLDLNNYLWGWRGWEKKNSRLLQIAWVAKSEGSSECLLVFKKSKTRKWDSESQADFTHFSNGSKNSGKPADKICLVSRTQILNQTKLKSKGRLAENLISLIPKPTFPTAINFKWLELVLDSWLSTLVWIPCNLAGHQM